MYAFLSWKKDPTMAQHTTTEWHGTCSGRTSTPWSWLQNDAKWSPYTNALLKTRRAGSSRAMCQQESGRSESGPSPRSSLVWSHLGSMALPGSTTELEGSTWINTSWIENRHRNGCPVDISWSWQGANIQPIEISHLQNPVTHSTGLVDVLLRKAVTAVVPCCTSTKSTRIFDSKPGNRKTLTKSNQHQPHPTKSDQVQPDPRPTSSNHLLRTSLLPSPYYQSDFHGKSSKGLADR